MGIFSSNRVRKGFGAMSPERRRAIAAKGGKAAQKSGRVPKFNSRTAKAAARKRWANKVTKN